MNFAKALQENRVLQEATSILSKIEQAGYSAFIVGGAVRDLLMGKEIDDVDLTTNCPVKILEEMFITYDIGRSKDFGILSIVGDHGTYETAQFRTDGKYEDGRRPKDVKIAGTFREDSFRRDFTVNAMGIDKKGNLFDYVGGRGDIYCRRIRAVGNPVVRFTEDHLRMIRAPRFASKTGFSIERSTRIAIRRLFKLINNITPERIRLEIIKAAKLGGKRFANFILQLDNLKLLSRILPEVHNLKYFEHNLRHHPEGKDVLTHVIRCLEVSDGVDYLSLLSILFHDIGKGTSWQEKGGGFPPSYHRHERASADLTQGICERLKFSLYETRAMVFAVKNHMKFFEMCDMKPSKIARLVNEEHFDILKRVAYADQFSRGEEFMYYNQFDKYLAKALKLKNQWENKTVDHKLKLVDGKRIMELLDIDPGPIVGEIKNEVEEYIIDNSINPDDKEKIDEIILSIGGKNEKHTKIDS